MRNKYTIVSVRDGYEDGYELIFNDPRINGEKENPQKIIGWFPTLEEAKVQIERELFEWEVGGLT